MSMKIFSLTAITVRSRSSMFYGRALDVFEIVNARSGASGCCPPEHWRFFLLQGTFAAIGLGAEVRKSVTGYVHMCAHAVHGRRGWPIPSRYAARCLLARLCGVENWFLSDEWFLSSGNSRWGLFAVFMNIPNDTVTTSCIWWNLEK